MNRILKVILIIAILTQGFCYSTSFYDEIKSSYEKMFSNCLFLTEFRFYKSSRQKAIVNIIQKATDPKIYSEQRVIMHFNNRNGNYVIVSFEKIDYLKNNATIWDGNQKILSFSDELDKNEITSNVKANIYKQKEKTYFEDSFYLPCLGLKQLVKLQKGSVENTYFNPSISTGRGFSHVLNLYKPITAEIVINKTYIVEKYRDFRGHSLTRILEPAESIDLNNLAEVEHYANQMLTKYAVLAE